MIELTQISLVIINFTLILFEVQDFIFIILKYFLRIQIQGTTNRDSYNVSSSTWSSDIPQYYIKTLDIYL